MSGDYTKIPGGDVPIRTHKSYVDKLGANPMKASFDNCFIKTRLGVDPVTGKPITIWDEQIRREEQLLESLGELALFFRFKTTSDQNGPDPNNQKCPFCYDERRGQSKYTHCPVCNGFGIIDKDPQTLRVGGYEWVRNPERDDGMFFTHLNMAPQKAESTDIGLMQRHAPRYWTVPRRNASGQIINYLQNRDIMIRFIFGLDHKPQRELERLVITEMNYSLAPENQLLHMEWTVEKANPSDVKVFALPNFLN